MYIQEDTPMTKEEAMMLTIQHRLEDTAYEVSLIDTVRKIQLQVLETSLDVDDDGNSVQVAKKVKVLSVDDVNVVSDEVNQFTNELLSCEAFALYLK